MTLESGNDDQGTLDPGSATAGTQDQDLDPSAFGDPGESLPDGGGTVGGIDNLTRDELAEKYSALLRGYTGASEEKGQLKAQLQELQTRQERIDQALQDPDTVRLILQRAQQARGEPIGDTPEPEVGPIGEKFGLEEDFATAIKGFIEELGYVHRDDPQLRSAKEAITMFSQNHLDTQWKELAGEYPGADDFRAKTLDLMRASGNSVSMEDALHAVSQGKLAVAKATRAITEEAETKRRAQVQPTTPASPPPRTPAPSNGDGDHEYKKDPAKAFFDAAKEKGINLDSIFGRKSW